MKSLSLLLGASIALTAPDEVNFTQLTIEIDGRLIGTRWVDVEPDGHLELCLAVLTSSQSRELRFHRLADQTLDSSPFRVVPVPDDAIAFGMADLREDPGSELFFLTKSGAWSLSLGKPGFRGNVQRVLNATLLYDIPDPGALPFWEYVLPGDSLDALLLPTASSFALYGPRDGQEAPYGQLTDFAQLGRPESAINDEEAYPGSSIELGPGGITFSSGGEKDQAPPFMPASNAQRSTFLSNRRHVSAPALLDINADGRMDMIFQGEDRLLVHLNHAGSFTESPDREEPFPAYLGDNQVLHFCDLDGDGDMDLVAELSDDDDASGLESSPHVVLLLLNDGKRLLPDKPNQVLRFEASEVTLELLDLNADGRMDLSIRKLELPSLADALTQFELKLTDLLFLGEEGARPVSRKPILKTTRSFDGDNITQVAANRSWEFDCTGDGIADLVQTDIQGNISIYPLTRVKKFFGGSSWELAAAAWFQARAASMLLPIEVRDINNDGLGDIVSPGKNRLSIFLSTTSRH